MRNKLAFWSHEDFGLELKPGADEVGLALVADAWSRTFRSRAVPIAATMNAIVSRNGMEIFPERLTVDWPAKNLLEPIEDRPIVDALDQALSQITVRYGIDTARFVAMQLEYTRQAGL